MSDFSAYNWVAGTSGSQSCDDVCGADGRTCEASGLELFTGDSSLASEFDSVIITPSFSVGCSFGSQIEIPIPYPSWDEGDEVPGYEIIHYVCEVPDDGNHPWTGGDRCGSARDPADIGSIKPVCPCSAQGVVSGDPHF
eukprot:scaffold3556_cov215-Prasinococcus_capsulatus_cf.AAC.2